MKKRGLCVLVVSLIVASCASATEIIEFSYDGYSPNQAGLDLDGLSFGSTTSTSLNYSLTMSADALLDDVSADTEFNQTASGFGINCDGSGDDTDAIDGDLGVESMLLSFDQAGTFESIEFDRVTASAGDTGMVSFATSGESYQFYNANMSSDLLELNQSFEAGESITIKWQAGNGFGLEQMSIAVPEPATLGLISTIGLASLLIKRFSV